MEEVGLLAKRSGYRKNLKITADIKMFVCFVFLFFDNLYEISIDESI